MAREIFFSPGIPRITEEELSTATASISGLDQGKLYVVIDERHLIRYCGHYMIYGSEHLCGVGASLAREHGYDYRQVLKRYGTPTVVRFLLRRSDIPRHQVQELARQLHEAIWEDRRCPEPPLISFSFTLSQPIPPTHILGHIHPKSIPDPLCHFLPYEYCNDEA